MTPEELSTLGDLNFLARTKLMLSSAEKLRLYDPARGLPKDVPINPADPDRGYLLGLLAATPDGIYWRPLIDKYAAEIGVTVKAVNVGPATNPPAPPVSVPSTPPPPVPSVPVSGDFAAQLVATLAAYDIHIVKGKIGVGMEPDPEDNAALHIGGRANAVILGVSNTGGTDGQNPGEVHKNTMVIADNDGGMRWRQYVQWTVNGKKRNTTNRRLSILALDSKGDLCKSTQEVGEDSDGGQTWYIRSVGPIVDFATYKVGGLIRILRSLAGYGATDVQQL